MIIGITGTPLTGNKEGKSTVAQYFSGQLSIPCVDLMQPVAHVVQTMVGAARPSLEEISGMMQSVCISGRKANQDYWLNLAVQDAGVAEMVMDNVFFLNEYDFIKRQSGYIVKVERADVSSGDLEFEPDFTIENNGGQDEFYKSLEEILSTIREMNENNL